MKSTALMSHVDAQGKLIGLTMEQAKAQAPAAFATTQAPRIKSRFYNFTSTEEIIGHMDALGYKLVMAKQNKTKDADKNKYGTHIVGFQHDDLYISGKDGQMEARPTIVMINNHFGTFPFDCQTGIYRLVCENRLMVKEKAMDGFRNRHTKYNLQEVKDLVDAKVDGMVKVTDCITNWSMREMTPTERFTFAAEALALRTTVDRKPNMEEMAEILTPRRSADKGNDLYRTFNVVQENIIKGGYEFNERKVRAITNPLLDVQLNQQLWEMASAYAKH